jgi:hypothetical protein
MTVYERKVCVLGAAGAGKTSLVRRFVEGVFSAGYPSTIGVKIDRKTIVTGPHTVHLAVWDIEGETPTREVRLRYLRGTAGIILVVDGTEPESLAVALGLHAKAVDRIPDIPFIVALNKADMTGSWRLTDLDLEHIGRIALATLRTSALTGVGVEQLFEELASRLVPPGG